MRRGNGLYIQIPCQPLSFDFTMANAYPFYSHSAFDPIKAYSPEQLKAVFRDHSWREKFRENARNPKPGMIFQGNWDRVMVAVAQKPANAKYVNRYAAEIAKTEHRDPLDVMLDLASTRTSRPPSSAASSMSATRAWRGCSSTRPAWSRCPMPARTSSICATRASACTSWRTGCASAATSRSPEGVRRLTSHPAELYGIPNRGRIAVGAQADMLLFDPATVGISPAERVADLPGGGRRTIRRPTGVHGVFCNGVKMFDGKDYVKHAKGPGHVLDRFNASPADTRCWRRSRSAKAPRRSR